jgi:hypothetical protein
MEFGVAYSDDDEEEQDADAETGDQTEDSEDE